MRTLSSVCPHLPVRCADPAMYRLCGSGSLPDGCISAKFVPESIRSSGSSWARVITRMESIRSSGCSGTRAIMRIGSIRSSSGSGTMSPRGRHDPMRSGRSPEGTSGAVFSALTSDPAGETPGHALPFPPFPGNSVSEVPPSGRFPLSGDPSGRPR